MYSYMYNNGHAEGRFVLFFSILNLKKSVLSRSAIVGLEIISWSPNVSNICIKVLECSC